ncbi:PREDICTED: UPF0725 protein EMB2204-like [Camelina sativa]|uniref:UPF0725 protein EMB2204-like n=1 Tax=Camelina sativa TaxID=90675 RepID=A0ABM0WX77_CAMSA|nr:PREDICTED: UPF0725 protein EMB2204-like [Camelina sativa]
MKEFKPNMSDRSLGQKLASHLNVRPSISKYVKSLREGFDYPNDNTRHLRLRRFEWGDNHPKFPFGSVVKLYAKLGLHRYNLLEGKNLQLDSLKSFTVSITGGPSSYYVSLVARVPDGGLQQAFQVLVQERSLGFLDLGCPIARPLVTEPFLRPHKAQPPDGLFFSDELPDWPSEIAFNDRKRFHLVKESELRDNDWIRLYLELALVFHDRTLTERYLSQLEIVQVWIETTQDVEQPNSKKTTIFYITYKDLAKARLGEPVDRRAIVRRIINEATANFRLRGRYWFAEKAPDTEKDYVLLPVGEKALDKKQRSKRLKRCLGVLRLWRLSNPRCHQVYKTRRLRA